MAKLILWFASGLTQGAVVSSKTDKLGRSSGKVGVGRRHVISLFFDSAESWGRGVAV